MISRPCHKRAIWEQTPPTAQELILGRAAELAQLRAQVAQLRATVEKLGRRLGHTSRNSSPPPSADPPQARSQRGHREPSGRRPGGQPGHERRTREVSVHLYERAMPRAASVVRSRWELGARKVQGRRAGLPHTQSSDSQGHAGVAVEASPPRLSWLRQRESPPRSGCQNCLYARTLRDGSPALLRCSLLDFGVGYEGQQRLAPLAHLSAGPCGLGGPTRLACFQQPLHRLPDGSHVAGKAGRRHPVSSK